MQLKVARRAPRDHRAPAPDPRPAAPARANGRRKFLAALPSLDAPFAAKCAAAAEAGEVLRYAATIADGVLKVSLVSVSADTPLGRLAGTDNLVEARSRPALSRSLARSLSLSLSLFRG